MIGRCWGCYLGLLDYPVAYALQKRLVQERIADAIPDTLLLLRHPAVYTVGRRGKKEHFLVPAEVLERESVKVYPADRGGAVTYHGPGQLVGYPILDVKQHGGDLHQLLHRYEEVLIMSLAEYGIAAGREASYPGVWVGYNKIGAVGIGVRRWISYHGWSLNLRAEPEGFARIVPCGIRDKGVTALASLLGREIPVEEFLTVVERHFGAVFELQMEHIKRIDLETQIIEAGKGVG